MAKEQKTNVMRILDRAGVAYEALCFWFLSAGNWI